jgi:hypothetical protein
MTTDPATPALPSSATRLFRKGPYPLHPDLVRVTHETLGTDASAFARPVEVLTDDAAPLLRAMMERILASGTDFKFMEN